MFATVVACNLALGTVACSSSSSDGQKGTGVDKDCGGSSTYDGTTYTDCEWGCDSWGAECVPSATGYSCSCTDGPKSGTQFDLAGACDHAGDDPATWTQDMRSTCR